MRRWVRTRALWVLWVPLFACNDSGGGEQTAEFPIIEEVLRTPDSQFDGLPGYDFEPNYVELGNLRVHYVDEGPQNAVPVILLHGEPTWSYLYRNLVPPLVQAGHRAIVPDLVGFGKSDKPASELDHTYDRHVTWLLGVVRALGLRDMVLVAHDFGGPIGLRLVAESLLRHCSKTLLNPRRVVSLSSLLRQLKRAHVARNSLGARPCVGQHNFCARKNETSNSRSLSEN